MMPVPPNKLSAFQFMWRQPPRLSRQGEARRPRRCAFLSVLIFLILAGLAISAKAATWTVRAQPTRLVNGAPVLFQIKSPSRLESLSGKWLDSELKFNLHPWPKTRFCLARGQF